MKIEKTIYENNTVLYIPISKDLAKHLELEKGTTIIIQDDKGKHGKFISVWKKEESR